MQELHSVRDQLLDETGRASKLEVGESSLVNGQNHCSMIWWTGGIRIFLHYSLGIEMVMISFPFAKLAAWSFRDSTTAAEGGDPWERVRIASEWKGRQVRQISFRRQQEARRCRLPEVVWWWWRALKRGLFSRVAFFLFWSFLIILFLESNTGAYIEKLEILFSKEQNGSSCGIKWSTVPITSETWYRPHFFISICRFYWFTYKLLAASWY